MFRKRRRDNDFGGYDCPVKTRAERERLTAARQESRQRIRWICRV